MSGRETDSTTSLLEPLTRRERQVLALLAEGYSGPEIAEKFSLALSSVKTHIQNIYGKLGANSKRQAITRAGELGLLGPAVMTMPVAPAEPVEAAPEPGESPFMGLRYFEEADEALFFGREALVARLVERLAAQGRAPANPGRTHFLAVVGASGSGKSSLVRAGLIPALRAAAGSTAFDPIHVLTPTAHPLEALAASLTAGAHSVLATTTLMDDLARDERALHLHMRRLVVARGMSRARDARSDSRPLLVVDQFEELFTLCRAEAERLAFIKNLLLAAAPEAEGAASVLITLRADFYSACAPYPALRDLLAGQQEYIGPMSAAELRQAIERPAELGRWSFAPGLVDLILRDAGDEPGTLPLLSHALLETWRNRRGRTLTLESYAEAGRVQGAIATTAEALFQELEPAAQALARSVFLRLTELGEGTQDTRRRVALAELMPPGAADAGAGAAMTGVLKALSDARLITTDEGVVQVAHEALIREWPTLRGWLAEDREGLRLHRRLTEDAQEWELMGRDQSELYRGPRLAQALDWAAARADDLNLLEQEFVAASQAYAEREAAQREAQRQSELGAARELAEAQRHRAEAETQRAAEQSQAAGRLRGRNQVITAVGALALLAALAAGFFGLQSNRSAALAEAANTQSANSLSTAQAASTAAIAQRDNALSLSQSLLANQLAVQAAAASATDPTLALLLATEAIRAESNSQTRATMQLVLTSLLQVQVFLHGHGNRVGGVAYTPDRTRLVSIGQDLTLRLWDVASRKPAGPPLQLAKNPVSLTLSRDGSIAAVGEQAGRVELFDLVEWRLLPQTFTGHLSAVLGLALSPDGQTLATAGADDTVRLWDVASGQPLGEPLVGHTDSVTGVALSPDGRTLASSSLDASVRLWDVASGQPVGEPLVGHEDGVTSLAYSPDGLILATGSRDQSIFLWNMAATPPVRLVPLRAHSGYVTSVAFNANGTLLASASEDGTIKLWNATRFELIRSNLTGNGAPINSVAFSPESQQMASGSSDGTVILWQDSPDLPSIDLHVEINWPNACDIAGRNLTHAEWDKHLVGQPYRKTCNQWP